MMRAFSLLLSLIMLLAAACFTSGAPATEDLEALLAQGRERYQAGDIEGAIALLQRAAATAEGASVVERLDVKVAADVQSPWGSYGNSEMRIGVDVGYQRLVRLRGGYAFVRDGLSGPSVGMGVSSGTIGVDFARSFLSGSDFVSDNPTFFAFHVTF